MPVDVEIKQKGLHRLAYGEQFVCPVKQYAVNISVLKHASNEKRTKCLSENTFILL